MAKFEDAYVKLREAITSGEFGPRERLVETDLSSYLGVSRPTVRSVLIRLEKDGLVATEPHRGSRVRSFSMEEASSILRLREVLEGLAARIAAEKATKQDIEGLRAITGKMEEVARSGDLPAYPQLNLQFHRELLSIANDEQLEYFLTSLNHSLIRYQFRTVFLPGRTAASVTEHQEIVHRLAVKDGDGAEQVARFHVAQVRAALARTVGLPV
jgi:DNA-binding GntR family transcriptional regulator